MRMTDNQLEDLYTKGARYDPMAKAVYLGSARLTLSPSSVIRFREIQARAEYINSQATIRRNAMRIV